MEILFKRLCWTEAVIDILSLIHWSAEVHLNASQAKVTRFLGHLPYCILPWVCPTRNDTHNGDCMTLLIVSEDSKVLKGNFKLLGWHSECLTDLMQSPGNNLRQIHPQHRPQPLSCLRPSNACTGSTHIQRLRCFSVVSRS